MTDATMLHPLIPGSRVPGDWYPHPLPSNIRAGPHTVIDSASCFKHYYVKNTVACRIGGHCTVWRASFAVESGGDIEIGEYCYVANASLVSSVGIKIGSYVFIAGGVTIADSDFHPLAPAARLADTIAIAAGGDRRNRPPIDASPVVIEDDVWIGYNATILKGVRIGHAAVVEPGALVTRDVPPGARVSGNPARIEVLHAR